MKVIVGLGNPGMKYALTRHNVGFWVIDLLSQHWGISISKEKWKAEVGEGVVNGEKVILIKPLTYMNLSGESVRPAMDWLKADLDDLCVIYDDLDMPPGKIRLRLKGSSGGHNGMKSIIQHLGTDQFKRLKVGIGRPTGRIPVPDYVLSHFNQDERITIDDAVDRSAKAMDRWLDSTFLEVMNVYNA
ncbi:aminoacyl-tRNA hydrolase [Hazenella coriacea]|uniref:Peptidyl-tRNA hydrolase n=1 Tax=Hazenella coriacea TaxID=1179467 RepID=A0A4R3L5N7_9BACL|nr:aminoacyl-tRNA hydrolase [Hazenella coriacea]TCS94295.1 peptidyl-tRNA hydrolase [Hazenella coriacea]